MEQYLLNCWALFLCSMLECLSRKIQSDEDCKNRLEKLHIWEQSDLASSDKSIWSTLKVFVEKYCAKAVNNWYHDKDRRINQKPRKKYRKRKASKRVPVTLLVQNKQRKRGRGRGGRCYHFVKRIFLTCQMKVIHDLINYIIT